MYYYTLNNLSLFGKLTFQNILQEAFTIFHKQISSLYEHSFPLKRIKIGYKTKKWWLPTSVKASIAVKNRLYKKWNGSERCS